MKLLVESFHLNVLCIGFRPETQKMEVFRGERMCGRGPGGQKKKG